MERKAHLIPVGMAVSKEQEGIAVEDLEMEKKRKPCVSLAPKQHGVLSRMQSKISKLSASSFMDSHSKEMN